MSKVYGNTFITGATGLLGSELTKQLIENNECDQVVCLVRDQVPKSRFFNEKLSRKVVTISGDLRDQNLLDRVFNEYEINTIFHLGAQTLVGQANNRPTETLDVNIRGTWSLLEAARNNLKTIKTITVASSDKAYGDLQGERYTENFPLNGKHPYDVSKSCTDLISQAYAHTYGMKISVTRCGNFFGPGDLNFSRIFPSTIFSILKNEAPFIRSNGQFIRDYIFVSDGASAYRSLTKKVTLGLAPAEPYNFSYGLRLSVLDVVNEILSQMGSTLTPIIQNIANNEIPIQCLDSSKAIKLLDWQPDYGFAEGVKHTIDWYKNYFLDHST